MQKYNVQVNYQIHKIKVDSLFPKRFANTILSQLPRTCFAVLVKAAKFVKILNPEKVRGYSVSMRYLVGRETTVISWDQNLV